MKSCCTTETRVQECNLCHLSFLAWLFFIVADEVSCLDPPAVMGAAMGTDTMVWSWKWFWRLSLNDCRFILSHIASTYPSYQVAFFASVMCKPSPLPSSQIVNCNEEFRGVLSIKLRTWNSWVHISLIFYCSGFFLRNSSIGHCNNLCLGPIFVLQGASLKTLVSLIFLFLSYWTVLDTICPLPKIQPPGRTNASTWNNRI